MVTDEKLRGEPAEPGDYAIGAHCDFTLGADLGQSIDPTALALIERRCFETGNPIIKPGAKPYRMGHERELRVRYIVRAAELLPLGLNYRDIADHLAARHKLACAVADARGYAELVFDETGNRAAGDMIRAVVPGAIACVFTGGEVDSSKGDGQRWTVSKANVVTGLLGAIESGTLEFAAGIADMETLTRHLVDLRRKISTLGHLSFDARNGAHDDYVTALGLALWRTRRARPRLGAAKAVWTAAGLRIVGVPA